MGGGEVDQAFFSRVVDPLTVVVAWGVPVLLVLGLLHATWQTLHARSVRGDEERAVRAQRRRDSRLLLLGGLAGAVAAYVPVTTWREARLGMLMTLPTVGAAIGLALSGLLPPVDDGTRRIAVLQRRALRSYLPRGASRLLWGACGVTVALAAVRLVLPAERPLPPDLFEAMGRPILAPTRALYVVLALVAVALTTLAWAAATAVVRRRRVAATEEALAVQEQLRRDGARRVVSWTTAAVLLLNAAMLTPFARQMGGILFGLQVVQRTMDLLAVTCVVLAIGVITVTYWRQRRAITSVVASC